ncbi:hypothetical protein MKOR_14250 [Mycolicibacillus koreensis]|nr:hypothetical protein MKOR_14250 [Mycolicibacillus koreensis]
MVCSEPSSEHGSLTLIQLDETPDPASEPLPNTGAMCVGMGSARAGAIQRGVTPQRGHRGDKYAAAASRTSHPRRAAVAAAGTPQSRTPAARPIYRLP